MMRGRVPFAAALGGALAAVVTPLAAARAPQQTAARDALASPSPALSIVVRALREDGRGSATAGDRGVDRFETFVWTDEGLCSMSAANREPTTVPWAGWRLGGRVVGPVDDDGYMVEIDWQRVWQDSRRLSFGPMGFMQVVMHVDTTVLLDELAAAAPERCGGTTARLEASLGAPTSRNNALRSGLAGGSTVAGGATVFRGLSGSGRVAGAARGGGRATARAGAGDTGSGGDTRPGVVERRESISSGRAEVWLVHTLADGTERAQKQIVQFGDGSQRYVFPPVRVGAAEDRYWVAVAGVLDRLAATAAQPEHLHVLIERELTEASGARVSSGGASRMVETPAPGAVVSFELPLPAGIDLAGQTLALRVLISDR
jgi:hypothetical protein